MSNNLISEYTISDMQMVQMDHGSNSLDLPVSEMHMKMVGQVSSHAESQPFYVSTGQRGLLEPISTDPGFNTVMIPNNGMGHNESSGSTVGLSSMWMSDQPRSEDATMMSSLGGGKTSYPVKRKAEVGSLSDNSIPQQSLLANKRPAHMGADVNSLGFLQPSAPQRKTAPAQSKLGSPVMPAQYLLNKKMVRNDSVGKAGLQRGQTPQRKTAQIGSASKVRPDSSEAVRSKMRESLAGALALASQKRDDVSNTEKNQSEATIPHQHMDSQAFESNSTVGGHSSGSGEVFHSRELNATGKTGDSTVFPVELPPNGSSGNGAQAFQQFQYSLPDEDVSFGDNFFVKDDLLQGNGLSWAFDFDVQMGEGKEAQNVEKPESVKEEAQGNRSEVAILTPENVAFKIEAELFKLFGGVNKKYREKGRSLLFNLKDRNNPELRERVMSGEISPERLCSMSAEELASKELSQWRMAKAEELAQMVVLPDTEVDIRRLVRKTHKGEFQVEVEHDDGIAAEVSGGTSVLTKPQPKKETEPHSPSKTIKEKVPGQESNSEDQDLSDSLIIPTDGNDLMQGMMVEELKDAEFLPPIVSLDEFMESLNSEPPFENISADASQKTPVSHGESPKPVSSSRASNRASGSTKDTSSKKGGVVKRDEVDVKKSSGGPVKQKNLPSTVPKVEYVWDGILQLNISSSVSVGGLFQSGEKTSMKEWPASLEIKGRVRLDAFEKFLQELPNSRTRAVMVLQFVLKDKSSEDERANLSEAIDSYTTDDRLGYAEPAPGAELYLCPPSSRILDILNKHMLKGHAESDNRVENGLIGVVVWRRNILSPNSSSHHHKHSSKKQPFAPPKRVQDSSNVLPNTPTMTTSPPAQTEEDDDDDIPPGFGPAAAKDDDDLPEFNFSSGLNANPSVPRISPQSLPVKMTQRRQRPVDQVRELIKKYGQGGTTANNSSMVDNRSFGIEPWNDDDDDDIPEWQPQAPLPLHPQPRAVVHGHRPPTVNLIPSIQHMSPMPTRQPASGLAHPPPTGRWARPPGPPHGARWRHH